MIGQNTFQIRQIIQKIVTKYGVIRPILASIFVLRLLRKEKNLQKKSGLKFPIWKPGEFKSKLSEEMDRNRQDLISV